MPNMIYANLHAYMEGILENIESPALIIHSVDDHSHMLFRLYKNIAVAKISLWQAYPKGTPFGAACCWEWDFFQTWGDCPKLCFIRPLACEFRRMIDIKYATQCISLFNQ